MKATAKVVTLFVFLALAINGCDKKVEKNKDGALKIEGEYNSEKANNQIKSTDSLGPAGKMVRSFFKNWEFKRFKQMHAQTVNSRDKELFIKYMEGTPIQWRNLSILSEDASGDDWSVNLSVEVTDVTCAFAACMINLTYPLKSDSGEPTFEMSPAFLQIQRFMPVNQTWRIVNLDGEYFIDICSGESKGERHENVMNYVLDASGIIGIPTESLPLSKENKIALSASSWLAIIRMDMDIPMEEIEGIMRKSVPLFKQARSNLKELIKTIKSLSDDKSGDKET